jgi:hypothetical protein
MNANRLHHEAIQDKLHPGDYRVEAIYKGGDGEVFIAIFVGSDAKARAEEYAEWKNSTTSELPERAS